MNPLSPDHMDAAERLDEIAGILAAGFIRLKAKQSSRQSARAEKSFVDFTGHQSRHAVEQTATENRK